MEKGNAIFEWDGEAYKDQEFSIPLIEFKYFEAEENIHFAKIREELSVWKSQYQNVKWASDHIVRFGLLCFPQASEPQILNICKIIEWIFVFDDYIEQAGANHDEQYLHNLFDREKRHLHDTYGKIYWDVVDRFIADKTLVDMCTSETKSGFLYALTRRGTISSATTYDQYTEIRLQDSAAFFVITSYVANLAVPAQSKPGELTQDLLDSNDFKQFRYNYGVACQLVNDVYSFRKEMKDKDLVNYVKLLTLSSSNNSINSIQESMNKVVELINKAFEEMYKYIEKLRLRHPSNLTLHEYLHAGVTIAAGNLKFSQTTKRYNK